MIIKYNEVGKFYIVGFDDSIYIFFDEIEKENNKIFLYYHNVCVGSLFGSKCDEFIAQYNKIIKV